MKIGTRASTICSSATTPVEPVTNPAINQSLLFNNQGNLMKLKCRLLLTMACAVAPFAQSAAVAQEGIKITPLRINEYRYKYLDAATKPKSISQSNIALTLRLSGDALKKATRMGKGQFKAIDDKGKTLKSRYSYAISSRRMMRLIPSGPDFRGKTPPDDQRDVTLNLEAASRGASQLAEITGTLTLRIAETSNIDIPAASLKDRKKGDILANDAFKKLGLTVEISSITYSSRLYASFRVKGEKADSVLHCTLVDGEGKRLRSYTSASFFSFSKYLSTSVSASKLPPDGAKIRFTVEEKFKDVELSLDQKSIPLP